MSAGILTKSSPSQHLGSAETTARPSARFADAAAVKSTDNLLLPGDGEIPAPSLRDLVAAFAAGRSDPL